jgi:hypothetical protein
MSTKRLLTALLLMASSALLPTPSARAAMPLEQALEEKPVLSNLLPNHVRLEEAVDALGLTRDEAGRLEDLVRAEKEAMVELTALSRPILDDDRLSDDEKRAAFERLDYNRRIERLARSSSQELRTLLGPAQWRAFLEWGGRAWEADSRQGGMVVSHTEGAVATVQYKVFGTQYDAYTTLEVAVPDKYVKFAAQGTQYYTGYPPDLDYRCTLNRSTYTYTVRVYEVGPWNIDDNYWDAANDPNRPRRMFTDLAQGMPESQAAYYDKYNGGKDQYGRTVGNPAGVDMSIEVASKMGLAYLENDWILVTYLWETGSTGGGTSTGNLVGYVRENDIYNGKGIAGATVKLNTGKSVSTDANGYYKFTGVEAGSYTVTATAKCYGSASVNKTVTAGIDNWASIAMTQDGSCGAGTLTGYIKDTDANNGLPVANATVTLSNGASTTSNSSGYYTFASVPGGTYTLTASANCYSTASTSVTVTNNATTYKNVALTPTGCGGDGGDGGTDGGSTGCLAAPVIEHGTGRSSVGALFGLAMGLGMIAVRRR